MRDSLWAYVTTVFCTVFLHTYINVAADVIGSKGWGDWSEPSACSRTCGGGVQYQERTCLSPIPSDKPEEECPGPSKIYSSCNIEDCPSGTGDFRAEQCARYNNVAFKDKYHEWLPYYGGGNSCELKCTAKGERFYTRHAAKVVDGTPCNRDTMDVCVDGVCQAVGCDRMLGSSAVFDKCHICGGNGTTCKTISGRVEVTDLEYGYNDVVLIPSGATSITFREGGSSDNYLAIRNLDGEYYLNGNWVVDLPKDRQIAGTTFQYQRQTEGNNVEYLMANGPTTEAIFISLIRQKGQSPDIRYEYSIPLEVREGSSMETYSWTPGTWSQCSRVCAQGAQSRDIKCTRTSDGSEVNVDLCDRAKQPAASQMCNNQPCPASWHTGLWEDCSSTCGEGVQVRSVICQQLTHDDIYARVDAGLCKEEKPVTVQKCNAHVMCPEWEFSTWSKCNKLCGTGQQSRQVVCKAKHSLADSMSDILPAENCDSSSKPETAQECELQPCEGREWVTSGWSGCEGSCTHGHENRQVICSTQAGQLLADEHCDISKKPNSTRHCSSDHSLCDTRPKWHAEQWGKCSSECGAGIQSRKVVCAVQEGEVLRIMLESQCDLTYKMASHQECQATDCEVVKGKWFKAPWGKCSAHCGGGERSREVLCLWKGAATDTSNCDMDEKPFSVETCNNMACNEDDLLPVGGCKNTEYDCCPDGFTAADGPGYLNCPSGDPIPTGLCIESDYGCCLDRVTSAQGPFLFGCPVYTCLQTRFGCCKDLQTPRDGPNDEGCPVTHGCEVTAYGCCPDKKTSARGPNNKGCPPICQSTVYGCCLDGVTIAKGSNGEGCYEEEGSGEDCADHKFGCCFDQVTPAKGPNGEGCNVISSGCSNSLYGCCPDGVTAANGYKLAGCPGVVVVPKSGCKTTTFGCCPDGETAALGPQKQGCDDDEIEIEDCRTTLYGCCSDGVTIKHSPHGDSCPPLLVGGCAGTRHGCCQDGETSAFGPNYQGCVVKAGCESTYYKCCPDGVTPAEGPNYYGCTFAPKDADCDATTYGCCPDGQSIAAGSRFEGCSEKVEVSCSHSTFGCCPDGESEARGPFNSGCPIRVNSRAACSMEKDRGNCSDYSIMWYFDATFGDCSRFWYGGCGGNNNRFFSKQECHDTCREPKDVLGIDTCFLPKSVGRCSNSKTRYFYNPDAGKCEKFIYGGCQGNKNNFEAEDLCDRNCTIPLRPDVCKQPQQPGPCRGLFPRWFNDQKSGMCRQFIYGGCKGNDNRFNSQDDCNQRCGQSMTQLCKLPKEVGICKGAHKRWYFDTRQQKCTLFTYGGCKGNANRFSSVEECEDKCRELLPQKKGDICQLPKQKGNCQLRLERHHYNSSTGYCEPFVYSGCDGNDNRFETELVCRQTCNALEPADECTLPSVTGSCSESQVRIYFDSNTGMCRNFIYSGCGTNGNNYGSVQECQKACRHLLRHVAPNGKDHCLLAAETGPCQKNIPRWYYNAFSQTCEQFIYGGCEGNRNRFLKYDDCERQCGGVTVTGTDFTDTQQPTTTTTTTTTAEPQDVCSLSVDSGSCYESIPVWFYDASSNTCQQFEFGGCGGNGNRFDTRRDCEGRCARDVPQPTGLAVCALPAESGSCVEDLDRWFYDADRGRCMPFSYGGCNGNVNNFPTEKECREACPVEEICDLPSEKGPCQELHINYFYDKTTGYCKEFYYGGCEGNANRFMDGDKCEQICRKTETPVLSGDLCEHPKDAGSCSDWEIYWYYNSKEGRCAQFYYGGCEGNDNKFTSQELCVGRCEPTTTPRPTRASVVTTDGVCALRIDPGECTDYAPVWYFEPVSKTCRRFRYGGCGGNGNNFETRGECESTCLYGDDGGHRVITTHRPRVTAATVRVTTKSQEVATEKHTTRPVVVTTRPVVVTARPVDVTTRPKVVTTRPRDVTKRPRVVTTPRPSPTTTTEFEEEIIYEDTTPRVVVPVDEGDPCMADQNRGPCHDYTIRWFFDKVGARCARFWYGGCGGNQNNHITQEACEMKCLLPRVVTEDEDLCKLPKEVGPCKAGKLRWYFDTTQGRCLQFRYGGCQGNYNNFKTDSECQSRCGSSELQTTTAPVRGRATCNLPKDVGPCEREDVRYHYDSNTGECRPFLYSGCQGNANNFQTQKECYDLCSDYPESYPLLAPGDCYEKRDAGPCEGEETRWYFSPTEVRCKQFSYGGCGGNGNKFLKKDDCWAYCSKVSELCGVLQCDLDCAYGLSRSADGCPYCECADACQNYKCAPHHQCVLEEVQCVTEPCLPVPVCKPIAKPGECPALESDPSLCLLECNIDHDCPGEAKCCDTGCGKICASPGVPSVGTDLGDYPYTYGGGVDIYGVNEYYGGGVETPDRPGSCPPIEPVRVETVCMELCETDVDCPRNSKCCYNGCGHLCMLTNSVVVYDTTTTSTTASTTSTALSGCAATVYGCCPDGTTAAKGWNYIGCSEEAPVIEETEDTVIVRLGERVTLGCKATGAPAPQVNWYKDRKPLQSAIRHTARLTTHSDGSLDILSVNEEDSSNYSCRAYNPVGSDTHTYTLIVQVAAKFLDSAAQEIETKVGKSVQLECVTFGNPRPSIRWLRGKELVLVDGTHIIEHSENTLRINIEDGDSGEYRCEANNGVGPPIFRRFNVHVEVPIKVRIEGERGDYKAGDELLLYCLVSTTESVQTRWYKDGIEVTKDGNDIDTINESELYISALSTSDKGVYKCVATVGDENLTKEVHIDVKGDSIPEGCEDQPWYANCNLIIEAKLCKHPYFSIFCCKSCHQANMLP